MDQHFYQQDQGMDSLERGLNEIHRTELFESMNEPEKGKVKINGESVVWSERGLLEIQIEEALKNYFTPPPEKNTQKKNSALKTVDIYLFENTKIKTNNSRQTRFPSSASWVKILSLWWRLLEYTFLWGSPRV